MALIRASPSSRRRKANGGLWARWCFFACITPEKQTDNQGQPCDPENWRPEQAWAGFCRQYEAASRMPASSTQGQGQPSTIKQSLKPTDRSHHRHGHIVQTLGADEFDPVWAIPGRFTPSACYSTVLPVSAFEKLSPSTHTWPKSGGAFLAADGRQLGRLNKRKQQDDDQDEGPQIALELARRPEEILGERPGRNLVRGPSRSAFSSCGWICWRAAPSARREMAHTRLSVSS